MTMYKQSFSLFGRCISQYNRYFRIADSRNIKRWVSPTLKELHKRREKVGPEPERPRSSYLEWNYEAELYAFGKRLGEEINRDLLKQALVQREYANLQEIQSHEKGSSLQKIIHNYEQIQDGEQIIFNYLKKEFDKVYPENIANSVLKYLTTEDMLSHIGSHIGLKDIILTNEFPVSKKTLSDTFKAVVSALKQSQDLARAENFVKDFVLSQLNGKDVIEIWNPKEPYEYLTQLLKERGITSIEPRLCNQSASNTILGCFQVGLYSDKNLVGIGWGENIKIAKETAALDALQKLYKSNKIIKS